MKAANHLKRARRIRRSLARLDPREDFELFVKGAFGACLHYIAYLSDARVGEIEIPTKACRGS